MRVGAPKETWPGETRVALIPTGVALLKKAGLGVVIEQGAGTAAGFPDAAYVQAGAHIAARAEVFSTSEIILQVRSVPPELSLLRSGQTVIGFADPLGSPDAISAIAQTGATALSMELSTRRSCPIMRPTSSAR